MQYKGPIGLGDGGSDDESGPSSRTPRKQAARSRLRDRGWEPTTEELREAEKRTERSGAGIYEYWLNAMYGPLAKKEATAAVNRARFNTNVRFLIDTEGLTKESIKNKIDEFARRVGSGRISVTGKLPWAVFMGIWPKLGGSASRMGLGKRQNERTAEDWLS